jgi:hypothetical protein
LSITSRSLGRAAYKRLIEAVPAAAVDVLDRPLTTAKGRRAMAADARKAQVWAAGVKVPSKWYAVDGSHAFYLFRRRKVDVELVGYIGLGRLAVTAYGTSAAVAYYRHGGQLTNHKPSGWMSAATIAAVNYGGLEGGPRDWGWRDNEDADLSIREVERLRALNPDRFVRGSLHDYAEQVQRALAGVR